MPTSTFRTWLLVLTLCLPGALSAAAQCRDPWIGQLYQQLYNRQPVGQGEAGECNIHLYNNGTWGSRDELMGYIKQVQQSGLRVGVAPLGSNTVMAVAQGNQIFAVSVLDAGGNLVASGGGNLVASGGGNLVASGGGNLVASGGGNLVASGGGNLTGLSNNTPGFSFGSNYGTLAAGQRRVSTSGKGALVVR
ncbi:hypothetical protein GKZ68_03025 [Hymenobacter sp. BRD128]|uniref:hypothetical protein n=1 Tax=Hymenobacter sp. BRD128 TaxID=2675878 RepID=UPI0015654FDB|nr:hypothetical protein [Hymenobacter sp. BRD128]QKG55702.1 hypothetical protein GKZ68_03025 [Hymenobacter sp. BRD128]